MRRGVLVAAVVVMGLVSLQLSQIMQTSPKAVKAADATPTPDQPRANAGMHAAMAIAWALSKWAAVTMLVVGTSRLVLRRKGRRGLAVFAIVVVVVLMVFHEFVEESLVKGKGSPLHEFLHAGKHFARWEPAEELVIFLHIPRTMGATMRLSMFPQLDLDFEPLFPGNPLAPAEPYFTPERLADPATKRLLETTPMIKGYFGWQDIFALRNATTRPVKIFTFLREPKERVLSLLHFLNSGNPDYVDYTYKGGASLHKYPLTHFHNYITRSLASHAHPDHTAVATDAELLERAKQALEEMDFVGFFEDVYEDFDRLHAVVLPHARMPWPWRLHFLVGVVLGSARLRVRKYATWYKPSDVEQVAAHNQLDLQLYNWALDRFGADKLFFDSFSAFLWANLHKAALVVLVAASALMLLIVLFLRLVALVTSLSRSVVGMNIMIQTKCHTRIK